MNRPISGGGAGRTLAWLAVCVLPVAGVYLPVLDYPFVDLDDYYGVVSNPGIRDLSWEGLRFLFLEDQRDFRYFPLAYASFALDHAWSGLDAGAFHRTNLLLHLANTALVFALVRALSGSELGAAITALLFGLHPLQVESVAWISSRKNGLFLLFFLASALAYLPWARRRAAGEPGGAGWLAGSVALFALSLTAKTTAVTLPAVLLLIDHRLAREPRPGPVALLRRHLADKLLYLPPIVFVAVMTRSLARNSPFLREYAFDPLEWCVLIGHNLFFYVAKAVAPVRLGVFYPLPADDAALPAHFFLLAALGAGLVACCAWAWARRPLLFFGLSFYLLTIAPLAALPVAFSDMPLLAADRYFYQSSIGLFLLVGAGFAAAWERGEGRAGARIALAGAALLLLAGLGLATHHQQRVWRGTIPLYERTLRHHPSDALYHRLALEYDQAGRASSAFRALDQADGARHQIFFTRLFGHQLRLSDLYRRKGDFRRAARFLEGAIAATPNAIETHRTDTPLAFRYLAVLHERAGAREEAARARERAESARPDPSGYFESFWFRVAPEESRRVLEERVGEAPEDAVAWHYLGQWYLVHGRRDRAEELLERAARLGFVQAAP